MKIDHIALWVLDIERMKKFYEKYFDGVAGSKYINSLKGFESYFIKFEDRTRIELMKKIEVNKRDEIPSLGYAHIAFSAGSKMNVDVLTERIADDGYKIYSPCRTTGDGYYESAIVDPEGNIVEITV